MTLSSAESAQPADRSAPEPSNLGFPVVGIGASAGGLSALLRMFEQMPAKNGMAFVVILHLSPKYQSAADSVLQRVTAMPVVQVTQRTPIQPEHVYVIAPNLQLSMDDGHLDVCELERPRGQHARTMHTALATARVAPPEWLQMEIQFVSTGGDIETLARIATPSTFTCPECHGSLWHPDG